MQNCANKENPTYSDMLVVVFYSSSLRYDKSLCKLWRFVKSKYWVLKAMVCDGNLGANDLHYVKCSCKLYMLNDIHPLSSYIRTTFYKHLLSSLCVDLKYLKF